MRYVTLLKYQDTDALIKRYIEKFEKQMKFYNKTMADWWSEKTPISDWARSKHGNEYKEAHLKLAIKEYLYSNEDGINKYDAKD